MNQYDSEHDPFSPRRPDDPSIARDAHRQDPSADAGDGLLDIGVGDFEEDPIEATVDDDQGGQTDETQPSPADSDALAALQAERDELQAKVLRIMADYQNLARRSRQSIEEARQQQVMAIAKALLTPLDQFDHALGVDPETTGAKDILQGVQIVRDELLKALDQFGVRRLDAEVGEPFDPNRHEALTRQQVEGFEPDHITAQYQPGYTLEGKVMRPAKVVISE